MTSTDRGYIFTLERLRKVIDRKEILKGITLAFYPDAKIGVIGRNGSGKTTLLRIMAGQDHDFEGEARLADGYTVGYVPQEPVLDPSKTVLETVDEAVAPIRELLRRQDRINEKLGEDLDPEAMQETLDALARVQEQIEHCDGWEVDRHLEQAMQALRCPPPEARIATLSGGEKRRVALCRTLLQHPDLLLLDEPTNHLDAETVAWLERHLREYHGAVILVTHDRYFLDNVAGWMLELENGKGTPYEGNYSSYLEQRSARLAVQEKQQAALGKVLARELEWIRTNPKGRNAKSKARIANYEKLLAERHETDDDSVDILLPPGPRLGDRVLRATGLSKSFGGRVLFSGLDFDLPPGGIIGIVGPNGAGKTTLLRMIIGKEKPDAGTLELGATAVVTYVDQTRENLDGEKTAFEEMTGGNDEIRFGDRWIKSRAYAARFNFRGAEQQKKVKDLSGGERNRLQLAKLLREGGNFILLDEPTNDLDVETLRVLEEAIQGFAGCLVVVTHDRYFLDRVATHILAMDGEGGARWFEGNYQAFEERVREERIARGENPDLPRGPVRRIPGR
ncbi:MAG: energy-dependent translational throttle protein EttA [Planctomycetaceae bacterium]|nr:energy-dependent translational throttle protein EttA [Planctomycetota bacterium]NUN53200.1 energy-dependent translational throttle protein EttA [Planctomycetaceae bacterium]